MLQEGFPLTKTLHNELDSFYCYFKVDIPEEEDMAIIIELTNS